MEWPYQVASVVIFVSGRHHDCPLERLATTTTLTTSAQPFTQIDPAGILGLLRERNALLGLTPCNLACSFCYRDASAPSRLTAEFLYELLVQADAWGVLEVSLGGGEPLLFKGLVPLLQRFHADTRLGLNLTTNGVLLTEELIEQLEGIVGEIRTSAYPDNKYRETLRRPRSLPTGVNFLVTPQNVGLRS